MTMDELDYMKSSISLFPIISKEPTWLRAFAEYNEDNRETEHGMLSINCRQCYIKVYLYLYNKHA